MARNHKPTLAEIAQEVRARPAVPNPVRLGGYNAAGEFFDLSGGVLSVSHSTIAPSMALDLARVGAVVAWEGCGCGGRAGCEIEWFDPADVHAMVATGRPRLGKSKTSITWIDVWSSAETTVVFAHGDVRWGDFMA